MSESGTDPDSDGNDGGEGVSVLDRETVAAVASRLGQSYVVLVVLGVVVGLLVAPVASTVVTGPVTGTVAVIPVEGAIDGSTAAATTAMLERARNDPSIDAVVLRINSPGGGVAASEAMYLAVERTAAKMPVVASTDALAASGAYYTAVASDYIYTKPGSLVGSVGVILVRPTGPPPTDRIITTGPDKLSGADEREWFYKTEAIKNAFVNAVVESRGDRLQMPRSKVGTAEIFTGARAVESGLADEIGGLEDAVAHAADRAGLVRYDVTVMRPDGTTRFVTQSAYLASNATNKTLTSPAYFVDETSALPTYLLLPPQIARAAVSAESRQPNATPTVDEQRAANRTMNRTARGANDTERSGTEVTANGT